MHPLTGDHNYGLKKVHIDLFRPSAGNVVYNRGSHSEDIPDTKLFKFVSRTTNKRDVFLSARLAFDDWALARTRPRIDAPCC